VLTIQLCNFLICSFGSLRLSVLLHSYPLDELLFPNLTFRTRTLNVNTRCLPQLCLCTVDETHAFLLELVHLHSSPLWPVRMALAKLEFHTASYLPPKMLNSIQCPLPWCLICTHRYQMWYLFLSYSFLVIGGIEPMALHLVGSALSLEPFPQPLVFIWFWFRVSLTLPRLAWISKPSCLCFLSNWVTGLSPETFTLHKLPLPSCTSLFTYFHLALILPPKMLTILTAL
jgi:hypothetical protein